jgi:hypothetical protein
VFGIWYPRSEIRDPGTEKKLIQDPESRGQKGTGSRIRIRVTLRNKAHLFMIVVDGVDDVLLAVLDNPPDGAADHVARRHRGDAQALPLTAQAHRLVVLQLTRAAPGIG